MYLLIGSQVLGADRFRRIQRAIHPMESNASVAGPTTWITREQLPKSFDKPAAADAPPPDTSAAAPFCNG